MKRLHLFEFNDLDGFPDVWRNFMTDYLEFVELKFEMFKFVAPKMKETLENCDSMEVVDLCSGASGPVIEMQKWLEKEFGENIKVTLTDLYPSLDKFRALSEARENVEFVEQPVDAMNVPAELKGVRTLFNAFHHFTPEDAKAILQNAAAENKGIAVFEATERSFPGVFSMLFTPLIVLLTTPFIRPFKPSRIFWTYLVPVIPLVVLWDGIVSALRTYTTGELKEMTAQISENYSWQTGQIPIRGSAKITYLTGYPKKRQ